MRYNSFLILQILLGLFFCLWWPLFDPSLARLAVVPALVFFLRVRSRESLIFLVFGLGLLISLPWIEADSRRYVFLEAVSLLFFILGNSYPRLNLKIPVLISAFLALVFLSIQKAGVLPFEWNQPIHSSGQEFLGLTHYFPSFFSNPSPMCLFYVLGTAALKGSSLSLRILFAALAVLPVAQSGSTLGLGLFLISLIFLFTPRFNFMVIVLGAVLSIAFLSFLPHGETLRPLEVRRVLIKTALENHSSTGQGPAGFQRHSGAMLGSETTRNKISRNQFHPHNDWVYHLYSYGWAGAVLRLLLYGFTLWIIFKSPGFFPLGLGLIQFQFTPDALSIPAAPFLFFLLGQAAGQTLSWPLWNWPLLKTTKITQLGIILLSLWIAVCAYEVIYLSWFQSQIYQGQPQPERPPFFTSPSLDYNLAVASIRNQSYTNAGSQLQALERRAPHFQDSKYLLGVAFSNLGEWKSAEQSLREKLRIDPYHIYSYLLLADILERLNRFDEAKKIVRQGLLCLPNAERLKNAYSRYSSLP